MSVSMIAPNQTATSVVDVNFVAAPTTNRNQLLATKGVTPLSIPPTNHKHESEQVDETLTTDAGSGSSSDSEGCSSVADDADKLGCSSHGFGPLGFRRNGPRQASSGCGGTPLEPIPGTPDAMGHTSQKFMLSTPAPTKQQVSFPSPTLGESDSEDASVRLSAVQAIPRSPKRRTRSSALTFDSSGPVVSAVTLGRFGTTPALPLPGSPKKRARAPATDDSGVKSVWCGMFGTMPATHAANSAKKRSQANEAELVTMDRPNGAPQVLKSQALDVTMAKAKRIGVPLKLKLPDQLAPAAIRAFDHLTPMKKRPVFAEIAGPEPANALLRLDPSMPVKKRVPCFLLEETFRGVQPTLGVERMIIQPPPGLDPMDRRTEP